MENEITPLSKIEKALIAAQTPEQSRAVESMAIVAKAWAKEQNDYELVVEAGHVYILARRKTTELIMPHIGFNHGNQYVGGDIAVTPLEDYGFTKKQWSRRKKELEVTDEDINNYIDECIEKHWEPTVFGLLRYVFPASMHISDDSYEWYTPPEYIEAARGVMGSIDLDPASSDEAQEIIQAGQYYTKEDDGLSQSWSGNVWLNPPYNMPAIEQFVDRVASEYTSGHIQSAIVLTNNSTDTGWFHKLIGYPVCFTKGRIQFQNGNERLATRQGQAIFYLGDSPDLFAKIFSNFGVVLCKYDYK